MTLEELQEPVRLSFSEFRKEYKRHFQGSATILHDVEEYLARIPGKQLRPLLLLLSARACNTLTKSHILLAAAMELLHNATLMHDDVVDESDIRRGQESVRRHWSNQVAVLCGDYYLAQVMSIMQTIGNRDISSLFLNTVSVMCQGELKQLSLTSEKNITTDNYLDIIGSKTASFMSLCCELGAMCTSDNYDNNNIRKAMHDFGYCYGMIFQIRDDLFDAHSPHDICFPTDFNAQNLIDEYTAKACHALNLLPLSPAKEALAKLLLPSSPSPTNS